MMVEEVMFSMRGSWCVCTEVAEAVREAGLLSAASYEFASCELRTSNDL